MAQGVAVKATSNDTSMATGTLNAIGAMYGPIMPVMKNIGRKETMTAKVAKMVGGRTSSMAVRAASSGGSWRSWK